MGMYTEIVVKLQFDKEVGNDNYKILSYLFNPLDVNEKEDLIIPEHDFFKCSRWESIGHCSSFYHHPNNVSDWYVLSFRIEDVSTYAFSRSDLKNYDNEIEKFFDWYSTLNTNECIGDFIGYSLYEEDNTPTIYNKK